MTPTAPPTDAGLILVRAWVEPAQKHEGDDGLHARIITAELADPPGETVVTAAGVEDVVAVVRQFLIELTGKGQRPVS